MLFINNPCLFINIFEELYYLVQTYAQQQLTHIFIFTHLYIFQMRIYKIHFFETLIAFSN